MTGKYFINKILFTMDYLFGDNISKLFEEREIKYELSNNTNRLRFIYVDDKLFATIKANGTYA